MRIEISKKAEQDLDQLEMIFKNLSPNMQNYMHGTMMAAASRRFTRTAKGTTAFKDRTGRFRKSIKTVRRDVMDGGRIIKKGGASTIAGGRGARQFWILEKGTVERVQKKTNRKTGRVKASNFFVRAFESSKEEGMNDAVKAGRREFNKFVRAASTGKRLNRAQTRALLED